MREVARKLLSEMSPVVWRVKNEEVGLEFPVSRIVSCRGPQDSLLPQRFLPGCRDVVAQMNSFSLLRSDNKSGCYLSL